ncbi:hypothetical protein SLE2022_012020 [Rubroshorea leprosula]
MAAGTREILGKLTASKCPSEPLYPSFLGSPFARRQFYFRPPFPLFPSMLLQRKMQVRTKMVSRPVTTLTTEVALVKANPVEIPLKLTAIVTVRKNKMENMKEIMLNLLDGYPKLSQRDKGVVLQLVSNDLYPDKMSSKLSKETTLDWSKSLLRTGDETTTYKVEFMVDSNFGVPGAITVSNRYREEFFLESIIIEGTVHFVCNSWVQPEKDHPHKRICFSNKVYLPCETPEGLKKLREEELRQLRGDGAGLRKLSDRIYDYDIYNDLGDPDKGPEHARPTLGGPENPHPRRCRTGRPPASSDKNAESPVSVSMPMYVPRDESLGELKRSAFSLGKLKGIARNVIPSLITTVSDYSVFEEFSDISDLYKEKSPEKMSRKGTTKFPLTKVLNTFQEFVEEFFKFDPPKINSRDVSCCLRDDEFSRLTLAGINPLSIERLKVFPPRSRLDPSVYGPPDSALKEEHIVGQLNGMSVQQALEQNKLFILDYHDAYLPFLDRINALEGRKAHATRTIFFLTPMETLKPIAIELSLCPVDPNTPSKQVLTPPVDATTNWLWQLAKAHVCSNDAGVHQLVHHWLRVHACMEPFIIAAHRRLSTMHPVFKLLDPHMRYTLEINAQARETLINAGGVIETDFTPAKYCMLLSCAAYRDWWRFDMEGLPADLIRRGMAIPDPTQPQGLRLLIKDYPYATDGLLIWSAIEKLVRTYVNYYYQDSNKVQADNELQAWYKESINVGHADVCDSSWWPKLSSQDDLASILTTIIWIASAQHAALNFGQYPYGGYVPSRPPLMRQLVPKEQDPEYADFINDPQGYFLSSLPNLFQATKFMAVIDIISAHSPDEEYIGERDLSAWSGNNEITEAFYKFSMEIRRIEKEIEKRNADPNLRNRCGAGITPYELLIPSSGPGVTGRGVPNSITV